MDPVAWFLRHQYAEPRDQGRVIELLGVLAELSPLMDSGLVHLTAEIGSSEVLDAEAAAFSHEPPYEMHYEVLRLLFPEGWVGPDLDGRGPDTTPLDAESDGWSG